MRLEISTKNSKTELPQDVTGPEPDKNKDFRAWMDWSVQRFRNEARHLGKPESTSNYERTFLKLEEVESPDERNRLERIVEQIQEPVTHPVELWKKNGEKVHYIWGDPEVALTPRKGTTNEFNYGRYFIPEELDIRSLSPEAQRISHCISSEYATPEYLEEVAQFEGIDLVEAIGEITSRVFIDINSSGELVYLGTEIIEYNPNEPVIDSE